MSSSLPVNFNLFRRFMAAAFWLGCGAVATLSLLPVSELPPMALDWWDKAQHATGFFGLCLLGLWAYPQHVKRMAIGLLLFGVAIELAQAATGWRTGDALDWLADATGVALALCGHWLLTTGTRH
jgi:VanZ family protein